MFSIYNVCNCGNLEMSNNPKPNVNCWPSSVAANHIGLLHVVFVYNSYLLLVVKCAFMTSSMGGFVWFSLANCNHKTCLLNTSSQYRLFYLFNTIPYTARLLHLISVATIIFSPFKFSTIFILHSLVVHIHQRPPFNRAHYWRFTFLE